MSVLLDRLGGSTVGNICSLINSNIEAQTGVPCVFSPVLDYENAMENYRASANSSKDFTTRFEGTVNREIDSRESSDRENPTVNSLMAWFRQPLKLDEVVGESSPRIIVSPSGNILKVVKGSYNMLFNYFTADMRELEIFEVGYVSRGLVSNLRSLAIDMTGKYGTNADIEECEQGRESTNALKPSYTITWGEGSILALNKDENFYASLEFEAIIKGNFLFDTGLKVSSDGGHTSESGHSAGVVEDVALKVTLNTDGLVSDLSAAGINEKVMQIQETYKDNKGTSPALASGLDLSFGSDLTKNYNRLLVEALSDYYKNSF